LNHFEGILGEIQHGQFFRLEPADLGGIAGGEEISSDLAAQKVNQNIVVLDALLSVAENAVEDTQEFAEFDDKSRFFPSFAHSGFADQFSNFEDSAGDGPLPLDRRVARLTSTTRPSSMMIEPTPMKGRSGYSRVILSCEPQAMSYEQAYPRLVIARSSQLVRISSNLVKN